MRHLGSDLSPKQQSDLIRRTRPIFDKMKLLSEENHERLYPIYIQELQQVYDQFGFVPEDQEREHIYASWWEGSNDE